MQLEAERPAAPEDVPHLLAVMLWLPLSHGLRMAPREGGAEALRRLVGAASAHGCCVTSWMLQGAAPILAVESLPFERTSLAPGTSVLTKPELALEEKNTLVPFQLRGAEQQALRLSSLLAGCSG